MGFFFRKSVRLGPIRLNFSKRGIGVSAGIRGLRFGVNPRGQHYVSANVPGTGLFYRKFRRGGGQSYRRR